MGSGSRARGKESGKVTVDVQAALAKLCCCDSKELRCDRLRTTENKNHTEMARVIFVCACVLCAALLQQWASGTAASWFCCPTVLHRRCEGACADF